MSTPSNSQFLQALRAHRATDVTRMLRASPALAGLPDSSGRLPLHVCAKQRVSTPAQTQASLDTARALLAAGADPDAIHTIEDDGESFPASVLWYALAWGRNLPLATHLLKLDVDPGHCMFALVFNDDLPAAQLLRQHGAAVDDVAHGETPLIYAVRHSRIHLARWLIAEGADVNCRDRRGFSALHHAVRRRLPDTTIRLLLQRGADAAAVSSQGIPVAALATGAQKRILGVEPPAPRVTVST
jgi:ankyrin repeat protein